MKKFDTFVNEQQINTPQVGDIVMIRYWLTGDITPVKIIEKKTKNYFIVSHKVEKSQLFNAPDHGIKKGEILGIQKGVSDPVNSTERYLENPNIRPDTSGLIPGANSYPSNDIAF